MRRAAAAGSFLSASACALLTFAQVGTPSPPAAPAPAAPPAAPAPAAPAPAAPSPPAPSPPAPSTPAPTEPTPTPPADAAPAPQPEQPAPGPGAAPQQPSAAAPTPEPTPSTPSTPPSEPKAPPAAAEKLPEPKAAATVAAKDERAPVAAAKASDPWQDGHAIAIELSARVSGRLNAASSTAAYEERAGLGVDGAVWFTLSDAYVLGLGVKRADLGEISATAGASTIDAGYATTALEIGMRAFPFRSQDWDIFVGLRTGLAWQDVEAIGLEQLGTMPDSAVPFQCSGVSGPGFALGAEVGVGFRLSPYLWLLGTVDANGYRLSSDTVNDCVPGIGAIATVSGGLGLLYAFDIGSGNKLSGGSPKLQSPP